jgi:hypothetical protein
MYHKLVTLEEYEKYSKDIYDFVRNKFSKHYYNRRKISMNCESYKSESDNVFHDTIRVVVGNSSAKFDNIDISVNIEYGSYDEDRYFINSKKLITERLNNALGEVSTVFKNVAFEYRNGVFYTAYDLSRSNGILYNNEAKLWIAGLKRGYLIYQFTAGRRYNIFRYENIGKGKDKLLYETQTTVYVKKDPVAGVIKWSDTGDNKGFEIEKRSDTHEFGSIGSK